MINLLATYLGWLMVVAGVVAAIDVARLAGELRTHRRGSIPRYLYWLTPDNLREHLYATAAAPLVRRARHRVAQMYTLVLAGGVLILIARATAG